jgi:thioredoxin reductase (NADPH)
MLFLARYARSVTVLIRSEPDWSTYLDSAIRTHERIRLLEKCVLREILGDDVIAEVTVEHTQTGRLEKLPAAALFVFIGQKAQTDFAADLLRRTDDGSIMTGLTLLENGKRPAGWLLERDPLPLETCVPGIFAAGDVRNGTRHGVAAAVGDGDAAVSMFWQYLSTI